MSNPPKSDIIEIDVCVITYQRPNLLRKLLLSLGRQTTSGLFTYRVIVVDNDRQQTAKAVVQDFEHKNCLISYAVEPEKNIALARNKSLNLCTGGYIAMIDDDERADKNWLVNLYRASLKYQTDVVFGRVDPTFPPNTPEYIKNCLYFNPERLSSGSIIGIKMYNTGNAFFKRNIIEKGSMRFDPQFGETGGEDTHFFDQLKKKGYPAVWCDEAIVFHYYPPNRARMRWILQRAFRVGNNERHILGDDHWLMVKSPHRVVQLMNILKCTAKAAFKFMKSLLNAINNKGHTRYVLNHLSEVAYWVGEMSSLFNYRYPEYR